MQPTRREFVEGAVGSLLFSLPVLAEADRRSRLAPIITADPGLVAYWPLDGHLRDTLGRSPLRAVGGGLRFVDSPAGGQAVLLEDARFLTAGPTAHLDLSETSIELLFQLTRPIKARYNPCLIAKRSGHRGTRFSVHVDRRTLFLDIWNGHRVFQFVPQSGPLKIGQWYHLVVTWRDHDLRVYVDGLRANGGGRFNAKAVRLPLQIGSSTPRGREQCDCAIDEVAIYDRILTDADIMERVEAAGWADRSKQTRAERERLAAERRKRDERKRQQLLNDPRLLARGQTRLYRGEHLGAISLPVGGLGAGCLQINGRAELKVWQIFGNFEPVHVPHNFFAVRARMPGAQPIVRALQTEPVEPFPAMQSLQFRGEYPFGWFDFHDDQFPVRTSLEVSHPLIPLNAKDSAIPCAFFNVTVENTTGVPVEAAVLSSLQKAVGYDGKAGSKGVRQPATARTRTGCGLKAVSSSYTRRANPVAAPARNARQCPSTARWRCSVSSPVRRARPCGPRSKRCAPTSPMTELCLGRHPPAPVPRAGPSTAHWPPRARCSRAQTERSALPSSGTFLACGMGNAAGTTTATGTPFGGGTPWPWPVTLRPIANGSPSRRDCSTTPCMHPTCRAG
ncbi:MAG TPA: hypothetical protein EYP14_04560 [Planctomycetaceae bacterium]|nr:hypothetical protein [Planctomycetaceae bacterium]